MYVVLYSHMFKYDANQGSLLLYRSYTISRGRAGLCDIIFHWSNMTKEGIHSSGKSFFFWNMSEKYFSTFTKLPFYFTKKINLSKNSTIISQLYELWKIVEAESHSMKKVKYLLIFLTFFRNNNYSSEPLWHTVHCRQEVVSYWIHKIYKNCNFYCYISQFIRNFDIKISKDVLNKS